MSESAEADREIIVWLVAHPSADFRYFLEYIDDTTPADNEAIHATIAKCRAWLDDQEAAL